MTEVGDNRTPAMTSPLRLHPRYFGRAWVFLAGAALGLMLIPAETWNHPTYDISHTGFDPNLIYTASQSYPFTERGHVQVSPESLELTALPQSQPVAHLLTTPFRRFSAAFDLRVLASDDATYAVRIGVWSARNGIGHFLEFGPAPQRHIVASIVRGLAAGTLVEDRVLATEVLGNYDLGQPFYLRVVLDKDAGLSTFHLASEQNSTVTGAALAVQGGPADPEYREVVSDPVLVREGAEYSFGGFVRTVTGSDAYKLVIQWLDPSQTIVGIANDWRSVSELDGWTLKEFHSTAPIGARFARLNLGSGNGTNVMYANLFIRETGRSANLLKNNNFLNGAQAWRLEGDPSRILQIVPLRPLSVRSSVTKHEAPELFGSLRLSLTVSASARADITRVVLENYAVSIPHQRWQVVKVDDLAARGLVVVLSLTALALGLVRVLATAMKRRARTQHPLVNPQPVPERELIVPGFIKTARRRSLIIVLVLLYLISFRLGSHPFDMLSAKVAAYTAAYRGLGELYFAPNMASLAKVWNGAPYHEAVFPYNVALAYIPLGVGWLYRLFLVPPSGPRLDDFGLEFLMKSVNLLFALASAMLIYDILRRLMRAEKASFIASLAFLANPSLWFSISIWGQNHVASAFLLLVAIWATVRRNCAWAWVALGLASLTRPQMLVPCALWALVLARRFPRSENLSGISTGIIVSFLVAAPLALAVSPSTPIDILANQFFVQEGGGNEPELTTVSLDAHSVWTILSRLVGGATGLSRFLYPSYAPLIGGLSYQRVSQILLITILLGAAALLLVRKSSGDLTSDLLVLATGTVGFMLTKTGLAGTHFLLALPLIILMRPTTTAAEHFLIVGIWSLTTFASMYSSFGYGVSSVPELAPLLHPSSNRITQVAMDLQASDWFITVMSILNLFVFAWLLRISLLTPRRAYSISTPSEER